MGKPGIRPSRRLLFIALQIKVAVVIAELGNQA
jgi:hypothetical protein